MPGVISGLQSRSDQSWLNEANLYNQAVQGFTNQQATGGYDPTQLGQLTGGYGNLATTGGYTPQMQQQFMQQATSANPILAANLSSAAQRNAAATGGNAQAGIANIQQQLGEQQARTTQGAQLGLNQAITANQLAGLGGLGTTEANVAAGRNAANAGLSGMYGTQASQADQLSQLVLQGLGLQFGTENNAATVLANLSKNPGAFQTAIQDIAALGGAAAGPLGAAITKCWIAEAIYGPMDIRTHLVRAYINGPFERTWYGKVIGFLYGKFGKQIAKLVRKSDLLKSLMRPLFDKALRNSLCLISIQHQ